MLLKIQRLFHATSVSIHLMDFETGRSSYFDGGFVNVHMNECETSGSKLIALGGFCSSVNYTIYWFQVE